MRICNCPHCLYDLNINCIIGFGVVGQREKKNIFTLAKDSTVKGVGVTFWEIGLFAFLRSYTRRLHVKLEPGDKVVKISNTSFSISLGMCAISQLVV